MGPFTTIPSQYKYAYRWYLYSYTHVFSLVNLMQQKHQYRIGHHPQWISTIPPYIYICIYIYIPQGTMFSETSALSCPQVRSPQIINGNFLESNCFLCHRWETSLTLFIIFYNQPWPACSSTLHLGDFHRSSGPRAGICYGRNSIHCIYRLWPDVPGNPFHHLFFHNLPYRKI